MANNKQTEATETPKAKPNSSTLSYDEYYAILMLAKKIRLENEKVLEKAQTPKEKTKVLEQLFIQYQISNNTSKEKELATLLKINIFIPNHQQFIEDYKEKFKKNVRLISDAYQVPAPFVFNKVMEIGKYEQFLNRIEKEGGLGEAEVTKPIDVIDGANSSLHDSLAPVSVTTEQNVHTSKKRKSSKNKDTKSKFSETNSISIASKETPLSTTQDTQTNETTPVKETASSSVANEDLLHHLESMQRYCTRLLDSNEQLSKDNTSLQSLNKELNSLVQRLRQDNDRLRTQNSALSTQATSSITKHDELVEQVAKLSAENVALKEQITALPTEVIIEQPRSIADETATERELRQQIKDLQFEKQELEGKLNNEEEKKRHYRSRAVVAEAELEQLQTGMQGIFKEVNALDLSFMEGAHKKS